MTPADYDFLRKFLKEKSGLDLSADKQYLVESRLVPLARKANLSGIDELVQKIKFGAPTLSNDVVEAMTTNETFFFRDKMPFDHLRDVVMPEMIQARAARRSLRIWCAAASTGQEPYSIAMVIKEMSAQLSGWRIEIIGTDISQQVLEKSKSGLYTQFEVQRGLPITMMVKHFEKVDEMWRISPKMRSSVRFKKANLLDDLRAIGRQDVIYCRNVLIYFDLETKKRVLEQMATLLPDDGYLLLGAAETVLGITDVFKPMPGMRGLYVKNQAVAAPARRIA